MKWKQIDVDPTKVISAMANFGKFSQITCHYLAEHGITSPNQLADFLSPKLHEPNLIVDTDKFNQTLLRHLLNNDQIVVYGDYDADGACATTIAIATLRNARKLLLKKMPLNKSDAGNHYRIDYFINKRSMNFGIQSETVTALLAKFPDTKLIITVDNGIVAVKGVQAAVDQGVDVIVTDHHEPLADGTLPPAKANCDIKRTESQYPFTGLSGTGVIYKLMLNFYECQFGNNRFVKRFADLVGLTVISDSMPVIDENRLYLQHVMNEINNFMDGKPGLRPVLQLMLQIMLSKGTIKVKQAPFDNSIIGFRLAPMINAVSRVTGSIDSVVDAMLTFNGQTRINLVRQMYDLNEQRKEISRTICDAVDQALIGKTLPNFLVINLNDYLKSQDKQSDKLLGIVGLVSGHLTNEYHRPSLVLTKANDGYYHGSGRSIEGVSIIKYLRQANDKLPECFKAFGGHAGACGVTVTSKTQVKALADLLADMCSKLPEPVSYYDVQVSPHQVTSHLLQELKSLAPFGVGFEAPIFRIKGQVLNSKTFGRGKCSQHLKFDLAVKNEDPVNIIAWKQAKLMKPNQLLTTADCLGVLEFSEYSKRFVQFNANDCHLQFLVKAVEKN